MKLAIALILLTAGCREALPQEPPPGSIIDEKANEYIRERSPKPVLISYRRAGAVTAVERPTPLSGVLDFTGRCIRLQDRGGAMKILITAWGSTLKRDSMGWFWLIGQDRLRHGASVKGKGGELASLPPAAMLGVDVPAECARGPAVEVIGIRRS
ncbi:MAG TPA: hypothetical protein VNI79_06780 [Sphingomicrobium sp.]|nr:hypothetical protein [Sphingomicrobium sp.]